ncbi:MAG: hypothetical protein E7492_08935 [Ruminococcaceae bacterium]|nr:hypothetical protein [Oscillospiraceae bacterium]
MIYEILFSSTGRAEKILNIISNNWDEEKTRIDLSDKNFNGSNYTFSEDDLCIVTTSVVEGRMLVPAAQRLAQLKGNGAKAIMVNVFGSRAVDNAMAEMNNILVNTGFVPVAAMEVPVQHSLMTQVEPNRPTEEDIAALVQFTKMIKTELAEKTEFDELSVPGEIIDAPPTNPPFKPKANRKCTNCGLCAEKCPVGAIPMDNPAITDKSICITCMRCVEICPVDARNLSKPLIGLLYRYLKPKFAGHRPNKLYMGKDVFAK